jgi:CCR4-NOT transcription complex subunit 7/8
MAAARGGPPGLALPPQPQPLQAPAPPPPPPGPLPPGTESFVYGGRRILIRTVWADTLEAEFATIRALAERYRYVAMVSEQAREREAGPRAVGARGNWRGTPRIRAHTAQAPRAQERARARARELAAWRGRQTACARARERAISLRSSESSLTRPTLPSPLPSLSQDTEFPGVVVRPMGSFASPADYHYQTLRVNVDLLRVIQLGLTFADENGELAEGVPTWQFNFRFSLGEDIYAQDSIELLARAGIDFGEHRERGIDVEHFGELLLSSGLVLTDDVKWVSFHSGYDFGYLLKLLTALPLPADEQQFFALMRQYFPVSFDVRQLMTVNDSLRGGLQRLADDLALERAGPMHQAGSDSLLTCAAFFRLRARFFGGRLDERRYSGVLYGLGGLPQAAS